MGWLSLPFQIAVGIALAEVVTKIIARLFG